MMNILIKIKKVLVSTSLILITANSVTYALPTSNFANASRDQACQSLSILDSSQGCGTSSSKGGINSDISAAVNILSIVVGAAAVIMVIVAGLKFITSGGDSNRASSARSTLLYALIGVAVAALAQLLVHFVLNRASNS